MAQRVERTTVLTSDEFTNFEEAEAAWVGLVSQMMSNREADPLQQIYFAEIRRFKRKRETEWTYEFQLVYKYVDGEPAERTG